MDGRSHFPKTLKSSEAKFRLDSYQANAPSASPLTSRPSIRKRTALGSSSTVKNKSNNTSSSDQSPANLLHRVTNSVSGLFSNVSWSEWLRNSISPASAEAQDESLTDDLGQSSSSYSERNADQLLDQVYPEEGTVDLDISKEEQRTSGADNSSDKPCIPVTSDLTSFMQGVSLSSSTSSLPNMSQKNVIEDYTCESVIPKPSTSKFQGQVHATKDDSCNILSMSFPDSHEEGSMFQPNGVMIRFSSTRKRLRDSLEECENEEDVHERERSQNAAMSPLTFTEQMKASTEPQKKKRPRFSISSFGTPLLGRQVEEEPSYSIFYPGKVMFGGAANHQRSKSRIISRKVCPRTPVVVCSQSDDSSDGGLSSAARRILNCIDKISSPLSDSKRVYPFTNSPRGFAFDNSTFVADFHKHRPTLRGSGEVDSPPVTKLLTPSKIKTSTNISAILESNYVSSSSGGSGRLNTTGSLVSMPSSALSVPSTSETRIEIPRSSESQTRDWNTTTQSSGQPTTNQKSVSVSNNSSNQFNFLTKPPEALQVVKVSEAETVCTYKSSISEDEIHYSFSKPEVIADSCCDEMMLTNQFEFKFSSPSVESESLVKQHSSKVPEVSSSSWGDKFTLSIDLWDCSVCLLQNKGSEVKCAACETPRPQTGASDTSKLLVNNDTSAAKAGSWGDAFKIDKKIWECDTCLLQNKEGVTTCVACLTPKSGVKTESPVKANSKKDEGCSFKFCCPNPTPPAANWGDFFKVDTDVWDCGICLLQNKGTASKCIACETPNPKGNEPFSKNFVNGAESNSDKCSIRNSGSCGERGLLNDSRAINCVSKPMKLTEVESKAKLSYPTDNLQADRLREQEKKDNFDEYSSNERDWVCSECTGVNKVFEDWCSSCRNPKSLVINDSPRSSRNSSCGGSFGGESFKVKDEWQCETCLVRNKSTSQKCVSCETPKTQLTRSTIVSEAMTGNFKFGVSQKAFNESSTLPTTASFSSTTIPSFVTAFPSTSQPLSSVFSVPSKPKEATTHTSESHGSSSIVPKSSTNELFPSKESDTKRSPPTLLPFLNPADGKKGKGTTDKGKETSASSLEESKTKPAFELGSSLIPPVKTTENKLEFPKFDTATTKHPSNASFVDPVPKVNPATFSFFSSNKETVTSTSTALKDNKELESTPQVPSGSHTSLFAFGQHNDKPQSTGFNFGEAGTKTAAPFSLGKDAATKSCVPTFSFSGDGAKLVPTLNFGNGTGGKSIPLFKFGSEASESSGQVQCDDNIEAKSTAFTFGGNAGTKPVFTFGGNTEAKSTNFNAGTDTEAKPTGFNFGGDTVAKSANFSFGGNGGAKSTLFNFGSEAATKNTPAFNFSSSATPLFQFGQSQPQNAAEDKPVEPVAPSFLNIEAQKTNPFNAVAAGPPQRRVIKKAFRRNK